MLGNRSALAKPPSPAPDGRVDHTPPFWELEDLILAGHDHVSALAIMSVRRGQRGRTWLSKGLDRFRERRRVPCAVA